MKRKYNSNAYAFALEAQRPPQSPETGANRDDDPPLSMQELSDALGWSRRKLEKLRAGGFLPYHRLGSSRPYYYLSEVKTALKNNGALNANATN